MKEIREKMKIDKELVKRIQEYVKGLENGK